MSKTARKAPTGYRPSGRQCMERKRAAEDCTRLDFSAMPPAGKRDADGVQRAACSGYARAVAEESSVTRPCPECDQRGWHKLSCSQVAHERGMRLPATRDAGGVVTVCQRPCRCGPDGCSAAECEGKR